MRLQRGFFLANLNDGRFNFHYRCPRFLIHRIPVAGYHKHRLLQVLASAKSHGPAGAETRVHDQTERLRPDNGDIRQ